MQQTLADSIAREIRAELARQHLTHRQLAEHLGLSQPQISKRLRGRIEFRPSELEKTAELLGVPYTQFLPAAAAA